MAELGRRFGCRIGENAFYGCENLTTVVLPESITVIQGRRLCPLPQTDADQFAGESSNMPEKAFSRAAIRWC